MKVGFYDSGLGGIKTLKDIIEMGLKADIYFLADENNKPYGTKSEEQIRELARQNVKKLVDLGCEIIVVACNTATSVAISNLREEFENIEIIGTEPAVKLAVNDVSTEKILLIATTITVNGQKLHKLIEELNAKDKIELLATDKLVTLIEDENFVENQEEINMYLEDILNKYNLDEYSHIILGCTHFPIIKSNIQNLLKNKDKDIKIIDGNEGIGKNLLRKINQLSDQGHTFNLHIMTTADSNAFKKRAEEILGDIDFEYKVI